MVSTSNHIIQQAKLDFQFNGNADGFKLQQELKDWFEIFKTRVEKEFDLLGDRVFIIDSLQIEIDVSEKNWMEKASQLVMKKLLLALDPINAKSIVDKLQPKNLVVKTNEQHFATAFLYFLQHGYLPWNFTSPTNTEFNLSVENLLLSKDEQFIKSLKIILLQSDESKERFIQIVPFQSCLQLFISVIDNSKMQYQLFVNDIQMLMKCALANHSTKMALEVYRVFLNSLSLNDFELENFSTNSLLQAVQLSIKKNEIGLITALPFRSEKFKQFIQVITFKKQDRNKKSLISQNLEIKSGRKESPINELKSTHQQILEPLFISNAGLVVAAAFVPALFQKLHFYTDNTLKDPGKAACLLQYLTSGVSAIQEYDLVLPKILCGLELQAVVNCQSFYLNKQICKEVDDVLLSIIEYWNVIQDTSIEGLRESFLMRDGKLSFNGKEWILQVAHQPFDMLLQQLPWNISMIQFPWMKNMLKTEWII